MLVALLVILYIEWIYYRINHDVMYLVLMMLLPQDILKALIYQGFFYCLKIFYRNDVLLVFL